MAAQLSEMALGDAARLQDMDKEQRRRSHGAGGINIEFGAAQAGQGFALSLPHHSSHLAGERRRNLADASPGTLFRDYQAPATPKLLAQDSRHAAAPREAEQKEAGS